MKKIINWIFVFVLISSFTFGLTSETSRPTIEVEFDELVTLNNYELIDSFNRKYDADRNPLTGSSKNFTFRPSSVLRNGNYQFKVNASDRLGNDAVHSFTFTVDSPLTIQLLEPKFGFANELGYTVIVETSLEAHCAYTNSKDVGIDDIGYVKPFSSDTISGPNATYTYFHNITNVQFGQFEKEQIWFICRDELGNVTKQDYFFTVDETAPVVTIKPDPNILVDSSKKTTTLNITTDDATVCWMNGTNFTRKIIGDGDPEKSSSYTTKHEQEITYLIFDLDRHEFDYLLTCRNKAGLETNKTYQVIVDFTDEYTIKIESPDRYGKDKTPTLTVSTTLKTSCSYKKENSSSFTSMSNPGTIKHTASLGTLGDGDHTYDIQCTGTKTKDKEYTFTIDNTAPTNVSIDVEKESCSLKSLEAKFVAKDDSGIAYFNYSVKKGSKYIVNLTKTTSSKVSYKNLELENGASYTWSMVAVDPIGNKKSASPVTVKPEDGSTNVACDTFRPSITFKLTDAAGGKDVKVNCVDDASGCYSKYNYSIIAANEVCGNPQSQKDLTQSVYVPFNNRLCVWAWDKNGNVAFKKETIKDPSSSGGDEDRDNDGTPDDEDDCPDERGTAANNGCPDDGGDETIDPRADPGDDSGVGTCGNSRIDPGEDCDRTNLGGYTLCDDLGLPGGRLSCTPNCRYDTTQCTTIDDQFDPEDEGGSGFAIMLIIIGIILALLGAGFLGFEKYYGPGIGTSKNIGGRPGTKPSPRARPGAGKPGMKQRTVYMRPRTQGKQPSLDQIREMERKKILAAEAKKKREYERNKLFKQFEKKK